METIGEAFIIVSDLSLIIQDYDKNLTKDKSGKLFSSFIQIIEQYGKGKIGNGSFPNLLGKDSRRFKLSLLADILQDETVIPVAAMEKITDPNTVDKLANLIGIYFRINEKSIKEKIKVVLNKFLEYQGDEEKLNWWLVREAVWNKDETDKLIKLGYPAELWQKGIVVDNLDVTTKDSAKALEDIKKQTQQLVEIAESYNLQIPADTPRDGFPTYAEAKIFVEDIILPQLYANKNNARRDLNLILSETRRLEKEYEDLKNKPLARIKVRVEIKKSFLEDTYSGVGVPGCFNPLTGWQKAMPLLHALESNSFFLRVYLADKMIANAVIALTDKGPLIFGLYNSKTLDLDAAVFKALEELTRLLQPKNDNRIGVIFFCRKSISMNGMHREYKSVAYEESVKYGINMGEDFSAFKTENVSVSYYDEIERWRREQGRVYFDNKSKSKGYKDDKITFVLMDKDALKLKERNAPAGILNPVSGVTTAAPKKFNRAEFANALIGSGLKQYLSIIKKLPTDVDALMELSPRELLEIMEVANEENANRMHSLIHEQEPKQSPQNPRFDFKFADYDNKEMGELINSMIKLQRLEYPEAQVFAEHIITETLRHPKGISLIVKNEAGDLIAYVIGRPFEDVKADQGLDDSFLQGENEAGAFYIDDILIHPKYRSRPSLLFSMFRRFKDELNNQNYSVLFMHARVNNGLGDFLKRKGAKSIKEFENWDQIGEPFELLRLYLRQEPVAENLPVAYTSSSAVAVNNKIDKKPGGIAFNALPIRTESVASFALGALPGGRAFKGDLDAEWARIQDVFNAGIRPSIQRISEYTAAVVASPLAEDKIDQVRVMLADILRRDEESQKLAPAEESCKQLLMALENGTIPT